MTSSNKHLILYKSNEWADKNKPIETFIRDYGVSMGCMYKSKYTLSIFKCFGSEQYEQLMTSSLDCVE